jgi:hypothetical protein
MRLCPPYGRAMMATFFNLLRAADQLDPRLGLLHQAAIGGEIIQRHAARGEAELELLADGGPVQRGKTMISGTDPRL